MNKDIKDFFDLSIGKNYYKPIITRGDFNNDYIMITSI